MSGDLSLPGQVNLKLILHLSRQDISQSYSKYFDFTFTELSFGDENSEHYNWKGLSLSVTGLLIFRESHDTPEWHLALAGRDCLILGHTVVTTCTVQFATTHVTHSDAT